jgi:conjugal transfer ATP-binding protein TraC
VSAAGRPGLTVRRLRAAVERDAYSDFLPMVAWVEEEEAFLCIDDGWGQAWELVPSAYMFAHVSQALQACSMSISQKAPSSSSSLSPIR